MKRGEGEFSSSSRKEREERDEGRTHVDDARFEIFFVDDSDGLLVDLGEQRSAREEKSASSHPDLEGEEEGEERELGRAFSTRTGATSSSSSSSASSSSSSCETSFLGGFFLTATGIGAIRRVSRLSRASLSQAPCEIENKAKKGREGKVVSFVRFLLFFEQREPSTIESSNKSSR